MYFEWKVATDQYGGIKRNQVKQSLHIICQTLGHSFSHLCPSICLTDFEARMSAPVNETNPILPWRLGALNSLKLLRFFHILNISSRPADLRETEVFSLRTLGPFVWPQSEVLAEIECVLTTRHTRFSFKPNTGGISLNGLCTDFSHFSFYPWELRIINAEG